MSKPQLEAMVEVEYRDNGRIHIIHVNSMTRDAVNVYVDAINEVIMDNEDSLLLSVHNFVKIGGLISPYFLGRMKEFTTPEKLRSDFYGRTALVNSTSAFRLLFDPLLKIFSRNNKMLDIRFFNDVEEAVQWVSEYQDS